MSTLSYAFGERLAEVETYLNFLDALEVQAQDGPPRLGGSKDPITPVQQKILYSSVYLLLYNLVESTMTKCLEAVAAAATQQGQWTAADLSVNLRREWVRVVAKTHETLNTENRLIVGVNLCDHVSAKRPIPLFAIEVGGGGNWDDEAIEKIGERLGFQIRVSTEVYSAIKRNFRDDMGPLEMVKTLRNSLAHGSISFAQCAEDMTVGRLRELTDKTALYLREVVGCFAMFIDQCEYLIPEARPA